jgi:dTDP-4-amino-4,6-dideoxygalactose transaminase
MEVPFVDLKAQYASIKDEIDGAIQEVINSCAFSGGLFVRQFEENFAAFSGRRHCVGVGSGTEALWFIFLALGIGEGDEVITAPNSFIATAEAISYCGARPVFIDVSDATYTIDPGLVHAAITSHTRAIVPVHLYGQAADMDPILEIAREHELAVVEDACQAHGTSYRRRMAGSMGDAGAFSFYPGKNLGAFGEAGAVVTDNQEIAEKIRMLRDHGQSRKYYHDLVGWNGRMDGLQGSILSTKLRHLEKWNEARRENASFYSQLLRTQQEVVIPEEASYGKHIYHVYAIRARRRDDLLSYLKSKGIQCGIHYPLPLHLQQAYGHLNIPEGSFPNAERHAKELISLPMYPELTREKISFVVDAINDFYVRIN